MEKWHKFKIASTVQQKTIAQLAEEAECSQVALRKVAYGEITSARISEFIDEQIAEGERVFKQEIEKRKATA